MLAAGSRRSGESRKRGRGRRWSASPRTAASAHIRWRCACARTHSDVAPALLDRVEPHTVGRTPRTARQRHRTCRRISPPNSHTPPPPRGEDDRRGTAATIRAAHYSHRVIFDGDHKHPTTTPAVLGSSPFGEASGYDLARTARASIGRMWSPTPHPVQVLPRLAAAGYTRCREIEQRGTARTRPSTDPHARRREPCVDSIAHREADPAEGRPGVSC